MPLLFAFMIVIIALQDEGAEHAIYLSANPPFVLLTRLGLVGGINAVSRLLQQLSHQRVGRFENGSADQHLQLLDRDPGGLVSLESSSYLLDFLVLGPGNLGRDVFFFEPAVRSARVCSMMSWAYSPTSDWKCW
jgi:hypothetical protein